MPQMNIMNRFVPWFFAAVLLVAVAGCQTGSPPTNNASTLTQTDAAPNIVPSTPPQSDQQGDQPAKVRTVTVYAITQDSEGNQSLAAKQMPISGIDAQTPAKFALEALLSNVHSPLPAGTTLRKVSISASGEATANFSQEFKDNFKGGDTAEALAINAVLSTLGQFKSVKTVQFLVEGKKIDSLGGNQSLDEPLPVPQRVAVASENASSENAPSPAAKSSGTATP